ncbi:MAG: radical SAM protein [Anaerotruncus sp.]|nr:radical SAM protein [Anaerotruncus sp.]
MRRVWRVCGGLPSPRRLAGCRPRSIRAGSVAPPAAGVSRFATPRLGRWRAHGVTVAEVVVEVCRDMPFFARSGGGVTLGGGEPLAQADLALGILKECRGRGIHTAIETCGHVPWPAIEGSPLDRPVPLRSQASRCTEASEPHGRRREPDPVEPAAVGGIRRAGHRPRTRGA